MTRGESFDGWRDAAAEVAAASKRFDDLVARALDDIPEQFRSALENVDVVIDETPDRPDLLGLYEGIPLTKRGTGYAGVLPDRITIFRRTIERLARDDADLVRLVRETVVHELAHHFGISDDRLRELGKD
jgi:predicted Zn-dependent protease with MMP-like domain